MIEPEEAGGEVAGPEVDVDRAGRTDALKEELASYLVIPGMRAAVLVSDEGLVVSAAAQPGVDVAGIAALAVDVVTSAQRFGLHLGAGYLETMSVEFQEQTVVFVPFTADVMLALVASRGCLAGRQALGRPRQTGSESREQASERA